LCPYSFIAAEQASFYAKCKATLKMGEFLVITDFSENYYVVISDCLHHDSVAVHIPKIFHYTSETVATR